MPRYLLETGRVDHVIVVEKTVDPYNHARQTLAGMAAQVLLGDGLAPLDSVRTPYDSLSISGMGARLIVEILQRHPEKIPATLVLQPNDSAEPIRRWALQEFHITHEQLVQGFWCYEILTLRKSSTADPSYEFVPIDIALRFGPLLIKQKHPLLNAHLKRQLDRLKRLPQTAKVMGAIADYADALAMM
jgi:tRNA (adenine22-N1)-methyltransferase